MKETLPEESQSGARVVLWLFGDILCAAKITQLQCLKQAWMVLVCGAKSNNQRGGQTASPMAMVGDQEMELPWSDFNSESSLLWRLRVESHFLSCAWKASSAKQIGPVQTFQMRRLSVRPLCKILDTSTERTFNTHRCSSRLPGRKGCSTSQLRPSSGDLLQNKLHWNCAVNILLLH